MGRHGVVLYKGRSTTSVFTLHRIMLKLVAQDGTEFSVRTEVATQAELIRMMVEDSGTDMEIPLPNVTAPVLAKVIEYCEHHVGQTPVVIEKPLRSADLGELVPAWDAEFVNVCQDLLFEYMLAANYLDLKPLLDLTCAKVASLIKGKSPEEIRQTFNIVNDFTPAEEAQIQEENKWCEE